MPPLALSTMWAQQERFAGAAMASFCEVARDAGYTHVEISHSTDEAGVTALLAQTILPLASLHAPTPLTRDAAGSPNTHLNLAGEDEQERAAAVAAHARTIEIAADHGVRYVVVHLGAAGRGALAGEAALRRLYAQGNVASAEVEAERARARSERAARALTALPAARRSLDELCALAQRHGVRLGIETRLNYHEIPSLDEAVTLLAEQDPTYCGYWHDVGHAEVQHRLGLEDRERWFALLGSRLLGCHLHDMQGVVDHRAPGRGDVAWGYIARGVANAQVKTLEIDQREPQESLSAALTLLRREGVV
jgi:sugar phosphate isomerase/epimerase